MPRPAGSSQIPIADRTGFSEGRVRDYTVRLCWDPATPGARCDPHFDVYDFFCDTRGISWSGDVILLRNREVVSELRVSATSGEGNHDRTLQCSLQCSLQCLGSGCNRKYHGRCWRSQIGPSLGQLDRQHRPHRADPSNPSSPRLETNRIQLTDASCPLLCRPFWRLWTWFAGTCGWAQL